MKRSGNFIKYLHEIREKMYKWVIEERNNQEVRKSNSFTEINEAN